MVSTILDSLLAFHVASDGESPAGATSALVLHWSHRVQTSPVVLLRYKEIGLLLNAHYLGKVNIRNLGCRPVYLRIILLPLPAEIVRLELGLGEIGQRSGAVLAGAQLGLTEELHLLHVVPEDRIAPLELGSVRVVLVVLSHK